MVRVDVVVVNKAGNPITGLTREDFTVTDEGAPQTIVNFDVVTLPDAPDPGVPRAAPSERPRIATNTAPRLPGRLFVVVFDNLNMSPLNSQRAKAAVVAFLDKGLRDGDRLMIAATAGGAWWTATMPEGREEHRRHPPGPRGAALRDRRLRPPGRLRGHAHLPVLRSLDRPPRPGAVRALQREERREGRATGRDRGHRDSRPASTPSSTTRRPRPTSPRARATGPPSIPSSA